MPYEFSAEEIAQVHEAFPELHLTSPNEWTGYIDLNAEFKGEVITDRYRIAIGIPEGYPDKIPVLSEIGGRTKEVAEKYNLPNLLDLHRNPRNNSACVCVKQEEKIRFPTGSNLMTFLNDLVIPYLYGLSYYNRHGKWAPWGEYSHGCLGLLEFYAYDTHDLSIEDVEKYAPDFKIDKAWKEYHKQLRKPSPKRACVCGSGKEFEKCHKIAYRGLVRLHGELKRLKANIYELYRR